MSKKKDELQRKVDMAIIEKVEKKVSEVRTNIYENLIENNDVEIFEIINSESDKCLWRNLDVENYCEEYVIDTLLVEEELKPYIEQILSICREEYGNESWCKIEYQKDPYYHVLEMEYCWEDEWHYLKVSLKYDFMEVEYFNDSERCYTNILSIKNEWKLQFRDGKETFIKEMNENMIIALDINKKDSNDVIKAMREYNEINIYDIIYISKNNKGGQKMNRTIR